MLWVKHGLILIFGWTSTHTHYQHISPHRHLPHCIQAGSGNPTAQKTYIKHFSYRKLQTCSRRPRTSCLQPVLIPRTTNWTLNSQVSGVAIELRLRYSQSLKPCELQKPIPNHQFSFCWICLPLLTLSIIRSSCPPSHHWTSLGFHFTGLNPISLVGLSGWPGERRYPKHINWSLGFPRDRFLDPPLLHIHYITGSHHTGTWFLIPLLCWWHTVLYLFSTRWSNGSCMDLKLPGRHIGMDERTSPTAQPGKDWASCLPCHSNSTAWLHDSVRFINNYAINFCQKS